MSADMGLASRHRDTPSPLSVSSGEDARQVEVKVEAKGEEKD